MSALQKFGFVFFSTELAPRTFKQVQDAAEKAGLPVGKLHELKPRNGFIRAIRELKKRNVVASNGAEDQLLHKYKDDPETVEFQFSDAFLRAQGVEYSKLAVVKFWKKSHIIECEDTRIGELATKLYREALGSAQTNDITAYVKRVIEDEKAKTIGLRDAVYFIGYQHQALIEKIKSFFTFLSFSFHVFAVDSESSDKKELIKAVTGDITRTVERIKVEVKQLRAEGKLTERIAQARLEELKEQLHQYKTVAGSLQIGLSSILEETGEAGRALTQSDNVLENAVALVQGEGSVCPLVADLFQAAVPASAHLVSDFVSPIVTPEEGPAAVAALHIEEPAAVAVAQ